MANYNWDNNQPNYPSWSDVPAKEQNLINSLVDQWDQIVGYTVNPPDWALTEMAKKSISSLAQVGDYMWHHIYGGAGYDPGAYFVPPQAVMNSPWARFGLTADDFHNKQSQYTSTMMQLTGTGGSWEDLTTRLNANSGQLDTTLMTQQIMQDPNMLKTYGWLRYGMNYDQFIQQKAQWSTTFGKDLSNDEGVLQLKYLHTASGSDVTAAPRLTLGQVEQQQAYTGISKNVVR